MRNGFPVCSGIVGLRKRKLQLSPLHFASSSRQPAKAGAFAYVTDFAKILLKVLSEKPIENFKTYEISDRRNGRSEVETPGQDFTAEEHTDPLQSFERNDRVK